MLLLSFTSCVTIIKWKYGITNPKDQTPEKLISFLEKHHYPDSCQFIFNDSLSYFQSIRDSVFRKHMFGYMIFDCHGSLIQKDTTQCQWSGYEAIKALTPDSSFLQLNGLELCGILDHIQPVGLNPGKDTVFRHPDFTVIVTWAKFLGTFNSRLFELSDAVKQNRKARIRLFWLNVDMQESWNLTKDQKLEIK